MEKSKVTSKGQMVIPSKLRKKYGIQSGTEVGFIERGGEIILQPLTREFLQGVCGMLKSKTSVTEELLAERKKDRRREEAGRKRVGSRYLVRCLEPALWPVPTRHLRKSPSFGAVAQLGERRFCKPEVVGSIPISSIMLADV